MSSFLKKKNPAEAALQKLNEGHIRFLHGKFLKGEAIKDMVGALLKQQEPFATILCCSDSRVPVDVVFDQPPGSLFVVRVAGNIAAPTQIASIEFAVEQFSCPLVLVLGHSHCAGVSASVDLVVKSKIVDSSKMNAITKHIIPSIQQLVESKDYGCQRQLLVSDAVHVNIENSVQRLLQSEILHAHVQSGRLAVCGAVFSLETGGIKYL